MKLKLKRRYFADTYTIGSLYIDGVYFCDTLEDKNRDLNKNGKFDNGEQKVMHETCIPFGVYTVRLTYAPKFKRTLPWLTNVPHFSGILIHKGTKETHTSGCILVGENKVKGGLVNSNFYEKSIVKQCQEAVARGKSITIEVI